MNRNDAFALVSLTLAALGGWAVSNALQPASGTTIHVRSPDGPGVPFGILSADTQLARSTGDFVTPMVFELGDRDFEGTFVAVEPGGVIEVQAVRHLHSDVSAFAHGALIELSVSPDFTRVSDMIEASTTDRKGAVYFGAHPDCRTGRSDCEVFRARLQRAAGRR